MSSRMKIKVKLTGELALKYSAEIELEVKRNNHRRGYLRILKISGSEHHLILNEKKIPKGRDALKVLPVVYGG